MDEITIWVEIDDREYEFQVDADEWSRMTSYEKNETMSECELEAREMYCAPRTIVRVVHPDGTEEEV